MMPYDPDIHQVICERDGHQWGRIGIRYWSQEFTIDETLVTAGLAGGGRIQHTKTQSTRPMMAHTGD